MTEDIAILLFSNGARGRSSRRRRSRKRECRLATLEGKRKDAFKHQLYWP